MELCLIYIKALSLYAVSPIPCSGQMEYPINKVKMVGDASLYHGVISENGATRKDKFTCKIVSLILLVRQPRVLEGCCNHTEFFILQMKYGR